MQRRLAVVWSWLVAVLLTVGCARTTDEWLQDLNQAEPFDRLLAVTALRRSSDADLGRVVPALLFALRDADSAVGQRAQESIALLAPRAEGVLTSLLKRSVVDAELRAAAVGQLAKISAVSALSAALADPRVPDRMSVATGLGSIGAAAIAPLLAHADSGDAGAVARAIAGLEAAGVPARAQIAPLAKRVLESDDEAALRAACTHSDTALLTLLQLRHTCVPPRRTMLLAALVEGLVLRIAQHQASEQTAALALQQLDLDAVPHLLTLCDDPRDELRSWSTMALLAIGERARPQLEAFAVDSATRGQAARRVLARLR